VSHLRPEASLPAPPIAQADPAADARPRPRDFERRSSQRPRRPRAHPARRRRRPRCLDGVRVALAGSALFTSSTAAEWVNAFDGGDGDLHGRRGPGRRSFRVQRRTTERRRATSRISGFGLRGPSAPTRAAATAGHDFGLVNNGCWRFWAPWSGSVS
jgi:hypothetical protein